MKRKSVLVKIATICLTGILLAGSLGACTNKKEEVPESSQTESSGQSTNNIQVERVLLKDVDLSKCVKVGDYQSLRVALEEVVVTDQEVESIMREQYLKNFPNDMGVKDQAVEEGDTVNIDYLGKIDGVAFDGGTASNQQLTIGSHTYISGFEDGLIGVMPGETVDLNLKFPDNYGNSSVAGKDVVFTVTVNFVIPKEYMEEVIPKLEIGEATTVAELRQYYYDGIYEERLSEKLEAQEDEAFNQFIDLCEFKELPDNLVSSTRALLEEAISLSAAQYGVDANTLISYMYQTDLSTFLDAFTEPTVKHNLALYQVAINEGLVPNDEELDSCIMEYASSMGYSDVDSYLEAIGSTKEEFREDYAVSLAYEKVMDIALQ